MSVEVPEVVRATNLPAVKGGVAVDVVSRIRLWHDEAVRHGQLAVVYALAIGGELIRAKEQLPHGEFTGIKESTGLSVGTINNYMRIAVEFARRSNVQQLNIWDKDGGLNMAPEIVEKVVKVVDGKSLSQLYWDWGIKKSDGKTGGFKGGGKKLSADARRAANIKLARDAWNRLGTSLLHELREESWRFLSVPEREDMIGRLDTVIKVLRKNTK